MAKLGATLPGDVLDQVEQSRLTANRQLDASAKSALGQFMTPLHVARFMASLFPRTTVSKVSILDPGAGVGSLASALAEHILETANVTELCVDAYEIDPIMQQHFEANLNRCAEAAELKGTRLTWKLIKKDFVAEAAEYLAESESLWRGEHPRYNFCIMNPPYKKISTSSAYRSALRSAGIETVNLYSGFVALGLALLQPYGILAAIIPRSFCNGPYYRPFREFILSRAAIRQIHLFDSRKDVFKDDAVLQENVIIVLEREGLQGKVKVSTAKDNLFNGFHAAWHEFDTLVKASDPEKVIHIPAPAQSIRTGSRQPFSDSLESIGLGVSTGPVVDFRVKPHLRMMPTTGTVPLFYPCHFNINGANLPRLDGKKPNAILVNEETQKWLYPSGYYVIVRRFSSKEERRRIVAGVVEPGQFQSYAMFGFENHLNVFHMDRHGLPELIARGLAVYLNSALVDAEFRNFSGHTQVNATDLRMLTYPNKDTLTLLGNWALEQESLTLEKIDKRVEALGT